MVIEFHFITIFRCWFQSATFKKNFNKKFKPQLQGLFSRQNFNQKFKSQLQGVFSRLNFNRKFKSCFQPMTLETYFSHWNATLFWTLFLVLIRIDGFAFLHSDFNEWKRKIVKDNCKNKLHHMISIQKQSENLNCM